MSITLNGNGTITGYTPATVADGGITNAKLADGGITNAKLAADAKRSYAHFIYSGTSHATITTQSGGLQVPFTSVKSQQGITGDTSDNDWTHATTGYYHLQLRYRQASGGDVWSIFGVTKGGASNCVGVSARTGSEDSHNEAYDVLYRVDSTSDTYQLMGWDGGNNKTVIDGDAQGKPSWTNFDTLVGYTNTHGGVMVDIIINKIGDL